MLVVVQQVIHKQEVRHKLAVLFMVVLRAIRVVTVPAEVAAAVTTVAAVAAAAAGLGLTCADLLLT